MLPHPEIMDDVTHALSIQAWNIDNWGTRGEAEDLEIRYLERGETATILATFETVGSIPEVAFDTFRKNNKDIELCAEYEYRESY